MRVKTKDLVYIAAGAALMAVCSWISVPLPSTPATAPFTLQTFAVFAVTGLLGTKRGVSSVLLYILLGLVGLPVFAGFRGGPAALVGTTGGYIIGFAFTALAVGLITGRKGKSVLWLAVAMTAGLGLCYAFGTAWFMAVYLRSKGAVALGTVLAWCVLPYIIPDAAKMALAIVTVRRLDKKI